MAEGDNISEFVKEYHFTKEELAILEPLQARKEEAERLMGQFIVKTVIPKMGLPPNRKFSYRFNVRRNIILLKEFTKGIIINKGTNYQNKLGWNYKKATPGK